MVKICFLTKMHVNTALTWYPVDVNLYDSWYSCICSAPRGRWHKTQVAFRGIRELMNSCLEWNWCSRRSIWIGDCQSSFKQHSIQRHAFFPKFDMKYVRYENMLLPFVFLPFHKLTLVRSHEWQWGLCKKLRRVAGVQGQLIRSRDLTSQGGVRRILFLAGSGTLRILRGELAFTGKNV